MHFAVQPVQNLDQHATQVIKPTTWQWFACQAEQNADQGLGHSIKVTASIPLEEELKDLIFSSINISFMT